MRRLFISKNKTKDSRKAYHIKGNNIFDTVAKGGVRW
jgi:hypothetical protein